MRRILVVLAFLVLAGCDRVAHEIHKLLSMKDTNLVVLSDKPMLLDSRSVRFQPVSAAITGDKSNSICMVLGENVPLESMKKMNARFQSYMKGVDVTAIARTVDGKEIGFGRPNLSWSKFGEVLNQDELSACLQLDCGCSIDKGVRLSEITIRATDELSIKGVYWKSTDAPG